MNANSQFWEQMLAMDLGAPLLSGESSLGAGHVAGSVNLNGD